MLQNEMLGVCKECGRVVYRGEEAETSPVLICRDCHDRRIAQAETDRPKERGECETKETRAVG